MKARAPGKLVLTGAYAVLEGAPALVVAVDRYAIADGARHNPQPSPELRAAFGAAPSPTVDTSQLHEGGDKLGLGSSAAVVVSALATRLDPAVLASAEGRQSLFQEARRAHALAQGGGSGIDIAAATYGGLLEYHLDCAAPQPLPWPEGLQLDVFYSGHSAKTSSLLGAVRALRGRDAAAYERAMGALVESSRAAAGAVREGAAAFVAAAQGFASELQQLGVATGAPIVTPAFAELGAWASARGEAFFGAGAGGGDVAVRLSLRPLDREFVRRAEALGLRQVAMQIEHGGAQPLA